MLNTINAFIQSITIIDLIDVALISLFIYLILIWFKKARARFMFVGILVVGIVYLLARTFKLYLTTIILQAFFAIFLFIIVVIFQDDFRQFFENIAVRGILRRRRRGGLYFDKNVEILSSALINLSRKKIGALVVVRGRDILERYIEAGIPLDGLLSPLLLETIFDPHVPSHDGAVIIEEERIRRFGCYLPLSTNLVELGRLGTRHAAALGLAERTDALCIVVSEEFGTISVAENGGIRKLESGEQLAQVVDGFYRNRFPQKRRYFLLDFLAGHSLEKVLAFIIAGVMWFTFGHRVETIRRDFVIPLEYRNLASERIITEPKPKEATVTFSGIERAFNLFDPKELKLSLDMSGVKDGENEFLITKDLVKVPAGLSIINIEPDTVKLMVHRMVNITVPIEVKTKGRPPSGVVIQDIKVEPRELPATVSTAVPRDKITIMTEEIDLKSISENTTLTPKLIIAPELKLSADKIPEVKVIIELEKKEGSQSP